MSDAQQRRGYSFTKKRGVAAAREAVALPSLDINDGQSVTPVAPVRRKPAISNTVERATKPSGLLVSGDDWTDENTDTDTTLGLGAEGKREWEGDVSSTTGLVTPAARKRGKRRFVLTARDIDILTLISKYKFGYRSQIERYTDTNDLSRRLTQLAKAGYVRNEIITQTQALWTPTQLGVDAADLDVPVLSGGRIAPSTIAHTVGLLNLGIDLELGREDSRLLGDANWPYNYRRVENPKTGTLEYVKGETIITERMIAQSHNQQKMIYDQDFERMRKEILKTYTKPANKSGYGPESEEGEEWNFVMHAPGKVHTPDMVLMRPRAADGRSQHVAIELELNAKTVKEWRQILTMYKQSTTYATVVYFTHKRSLVNSLRKINEEHVNLGPDQLVLRKYIPENRNIPFWG